MQRARSRSTGLCHAIVLLAIPLALSCGPSEDQATLTFQDDNTVTVSVVSDLHTPDKPRDIARIATLREAVLAGQDPWSVRFARVNADTERVILDRRKGLLTSVEHSARMTTEELEHCFSDVNATVHVTRRDGWSELTVVPGAGGRATREQRAKFQRELTLFSREAARYLTAVDRLYRYLDTNPERARYVFAAVYADDEEPVPVEREEAPLVLEVRTSIEVITHLAADLNDDEHGGELVSLAGVVMNPLPAEFTVRTPSEATVVEGFKMEKDVYRIEAPTLLDALVSLQGKWVDPDPLAVALKSDSSTTDEAIEQLAHAARRSTAVVNPSDVEQALTAGLSLAPVYRLRWIDKARREDP